MKIQTRYFPFSPGIGWKIKNGKYIIPKINLNVWKNITDNKKITVVAYGGLIESYFSLCYLEMLNYLLPNNQIFWCGDYKFKSLIDLNGIAKITNSCPKNILSNYPSPIFMDKDKNIYFNCLNNYQIVKPYYGGNGYVDKSLISKQLLRNLISSWDVQYLPKFRNMNYPPKYFLNWSKVNKFDINKPFVCFFCKSEWSEHKISAVEWNEYQIKSLASILRQQGISTIIFTNNNIKFYGSALYCIPFVDLESILYLLNKNCAVLSEDIDFLFLAMLLSNKSKIIMKKNKRKFNLQSNNRFLNIERDNVFISNKITPLEVINIINYK